MLPIFLRHDSIAVGPQFELTFQRTLRIPDDGREYPLPPGLGSFPLRRVADYADRVPAEWREAGGFFLPIHQREALWLSFHGADWHPVAVRVGAGDVCALTGDEWKPGLSANPQNYMVVPDQPWLDGINAGAGYIRQFVATPLGTGATIESQLTGRDAGGLRISVTMPKPGRFPDRAPQRPHHGGMGDGACYSVCESAAPLGLAAGGRMTQSIYPYPHGVDTWDAATTTEARIHMADARTWAAVTGEPTPASPADVRSYMAAGLPWFGLYDEHLGDVAAPERLAGVRSMEEVHGLRLA